MAKSLRSKPKLRAKSIKRKGEFSRFVNDRDKRLAEKNKLNLEAQTASKQATKEDYMEEDNQEQRQEGVKPQTINFMEVSTAGGKRTARTRFKAKKGKSKFKSKTLVF